MKKEEQLRMAKDMASLFLYIPMQESEYSPIVVQHPYFESALLCDSQESKNILNGMFNALEDKKRYIDYLHNFEKKKIEPCEKIGDLLRLMRKSYRLTFLFYLRQDKIITLKECGNLLAEQWTLIENLNADVNVSKSTILKWIKAADKDKLMNENEMQIYNSFPDSITVYRGCRKAEAVNGMSWTTSLETAKWFAKRFADDGGIVFSADVKKEDIVCYLDGRGEKEVVVDYRKLTNIRQV